MATSSKTAATESGEMIAGLSIADHEASLAGKRVANIGNLSGDWAYDPTAPPGQQIMNLSDLDPAKLSPQHAAGVRFRDVPANFDTYRPDSEPAEPVTPPTGSTSNTASGGTPASGT